MDRYSFTLQVSGIYPQRDDYEDRLFEAGCDDALVAIVDGALYVDFDREAPSFDSAVTSAIVNVQQAGGSVVKIEPIDP